MSGILIYSWSYLGLQLDRVPGNVPELAYDNSHYFENRRAGAVPAPSSASIAGVSFTSNDALQTWLIGGAGAFMVLAVVGMILLRTRRSS